MATSLPSLGIGSGYYDSQLSILGSNDLGSVSPPVATNVPALADNTTTPTNSGTLGSIISALGTDALGITALETHGGVASAGGNLTTIPGTVVSGTGVYSGGIASLGGGSSGLLIVGGLLAVGVVAFMAFKHKK